MHAVTYGTRPLRWLGGEEGVVAAWKEIVVGCAWHGVSGCRGTSEAHAVAKKWCF